MSMEAKVKYVNFMFFKVDPAVRRLEAKERAALSNGFLDKFQSLKSRMDIRSYLVSGLRNDCDFLLWYIGTDLSESQKVVSEIYSTGLGKYLNLAYTYPAATKPTPYFKMERPQNFEHGPSDKKYLFVYPFTKTHEWYQLPFEERQKMMGEHRGVSLKFDMILTNTLYTFGLSDYDFLLAFECDEPRDFSDLVQALRETRARVYTKQDTPLFPCTNKGIEEILSSIGL
jgi:chlorite dismutase